MEKNFRKGSLLDETKSLCPICLKIIPAFLYTDGARVYMEKSCSDHGVFNSLVWSDLELYQRSFKFRKSGTPPAQRATDLDKGCPYNCGLCPEHKQHTCLAIVEITQRCNLNCPVCLASSSSDESDLGIEQIESMLRNLIKYEGQPIPIQISGGEPTVRDDLIEIVKMAKSLGFDSIEIDTNGISLSEDRSFLGELADSGVSGIYLQFDGLSNGIYSSIRGEKLVSIKKRAIENALRAGLKVTLAVTVLKGINDHQLWKIVKYAIEKGVSGVNFQPFAAVGRFPEEFQKPMKKVTTSDIIRNIQKQSGGRLEADDFIPVPCPDNRCAALTYIIIKDGKIVPINKIVNAEELLDYYSRFASFDEVLEKVHELSEEKCSCSPIFGSQYNGEFISSEVRGDQYLSIGVHSLQDIWNIDLKRLKKCCVHLLTPEKKLIPFCLYNTTSLTGESLYRNHTNSQISNGKRK